VYLPASEPEQVAGIRILASLGIPAAVDLADGPARWDLLADLATYALLGLVPRAPIEPFDHAWLCYRPDAFTNLGAVWFDDPTRYLHLDDDGRVSVSASERAAGRFLAESVTALAHPEDAPEYQAYVDRWRDLFLEAEGCAACEAWRICRGRFRGVSPDGGCRSFLSELMAVVEQRQAQPAGKAPTWQP
jgi:hypothetical protein